MKVFPSIEKVYAFFCPSRWEHALKHVNECLSYPCITLNQVDGLYNELGAAQRIVRGQFIGIYSLSTAKEEYNAQAANLAADMFIAKYGNYCSLYDIMLYFSNYLLEYKGSYAQFDVTDILQQFSRKYLPWKRARVQPEEEQTTREKGITLEEMVFRWVAEGRTDEDFREGGLYMMGQITDEMIKEARNKFANEREAQTF